MLKTAGWLLPAILALAGVRHPANAMSKRSARRWRPSAKTRRWLARRVA